VDHRAIELKRARDFGLAAEKLDQSLGAIHRRQAYAVKLVLTMLQRSVPDGTY
jgi:hypothetical protein